MVKIKDFNIGSKILGGGGARTTRALTQHAGMH